jgi:hypothetical protein
MAAEDNGQAPVPAAPASSVPDGMVMIPLGGQPSDIIIPTGVAVAMLAALLERDDAGFTVLLGEAMVGLRLAKVRSRDQPGPRTGPEDRKPARAPAG